MGHLHVRLRTNVIENSRVNVPKMSNWKSDFEWAIYTNICKIRLESDIGYKLILNAALKTQV